jgi:hypothetical protein
MANFTHNDPLLTILTHACQRKSVGETGIYWKVIHNLKTGVEKGRKKFPQDNLKLQG